MKDFRSVVREWLRVPADIIGEPSADQDTTGRTLARLPVIRDVQQHGGGHVDFYGYHVPSRGWMFCGWITTDRPLPDVGPSVRAQFENGPLSANALMATYARKDLQAPGIGVLLYVPSSGAPLGLLVSIAIETPAFRWTITPSQRVQFLRDSALTEAVLHIVGTLLPGVNQDELTRLVSRRGFIGANTLGQLTDRIFLEVDEAIACPPHGLVLVGWATWSEPGPVRAIRVHCGDHVSELNLADCVRLARPDVLAAVGEQYGMQAIRCGFMGLLEDAVRPGETLYIEVETARGEFAYGGIPQPKLTDMSAITFLLGQLDVRYGEVADAYDKIGPAVSLLNAERLRTEPRFQTIDFGTPPPAPVLTVIVTLHGRLDFMEYQFGFLSRRTPTIATELTYVLDDPGKQRQAEQLAASIYERFRIPLRLAVLERNLGFAPANNVGLGLARGEYVCFLNSDVFAGSDDWMERLVDRLRVDRQLGAVGPLLLFEDDSVQHQGMVYERLAEFSGWHFPMHTRKGWRRSAQRGMIICQAITAACIVMRTDVARELGGFDEAYIIGDFEDSDLCLKLRRRGLLSGVDLDTHLYHLERQSQAGSEQGGRMNLTLYNAWVHERRWGSMIRGLDAPVLKEQTP